MIRLITGWWRRKVREWQNDARQLWLWLCLAFRKDRDAHATATMSHQMQFLQGRMMNPINLFTLAIGAIALLPIIGGIQEWRINRVKAERDAPCSSSETERGDNGRFRTSREACATLGATHEAAQAWRDRAEAERVRRERDVATIQQEVNRTLEEERQRRVRDAESVARQRRRVNEAIVSAFGGPAPDLDRSVCELAGNDACGAAAGGADGGSIADPASVPARPGDAQLAPTPDAAAGAAGAAGAAH